MKFSMVKPSIAVMSLLFIGVMLIVPIYILYLGELLYGVIFLAVWLFTFGGMFIQCILKKIEIGEKGVKFTSLTKKYEMSWNEIRIIGIGFIPIKAPGKQPWIYFSADGLSTPMLSGNLINDKFFIVSYRKKIEDAIRMYWTDNIDGLDNTSDFEKRMNTKRKLT